jgi:hypothetical protein
MQELEREVTRLQAALDESLWDILEDSKAPQAARDAANQILKERLNDKLVAAIADFQVGTFKFLTLIESLETAVEALGKKAGARTTNKLKSLLNQAHEVNRLRHDLEGMRTTHTSQQEVADSLRWTCPA